MVRFEAPLIVDYIYNDLLTLAFAEYFNHTVKESTRVVVEDDPIVYLPPFPWFSVSFSQFRKNKSKKQF